MHVYNPEELLPIVAELAARHTSGASSSVSCETVQQLMEAVLYCIGTLEDNTDTLPANPKGLTALQAYRLGLERVIAKTADARDAWITLIRSFQDYGNENYRDTVTQAIPGFFKYYDPVFAPQNSIITMDYPVLNQDFARCGINAISPYVEAVALEQEFLQALPEPYVRRILSACDPHYEQQFFNISTVLLRHLLGNRIIGKRPTEPAIDAHYEKLAAWARQGTHSEKLAILEALFNSLAERFTRGPALRLYFQAELSEFLLRLELTAEASWLRNVVVL